MSGRGVKRRRPPALVLDGYTSDTAPAALTNGTSPAASASASAVAGPSRLSTRQESRRSSAASTADVLVNTYGTRSRMTTADTGASSAGAGATSRGSSRSPAKRDAEATPTSTKRVRGRKRDLASQFAEDDANEEKIVEEVQEGEAEAEEEMDAEQSAAKTQEMEEMWERWNEEYFEIVEQLPLELHRSFALMRELEVKLQNRIKTIGKDTRAYRDARQALRAHSESTARARAVDLMPSSDGMQLDTDTPAATEPSISSSEGKGKGRAIEDPPSSSQLQQELGTMTPPPDVDSDATQPLSPKAASATPAPSAPPPTRAQRLALLQNVSRCVADGVRAAEEKVGLAVTAYDWVDRHIRRLDADLQKSESSLLLGLRAGTEASRGVREALGMTEDEVRERVEREEETSTQGGTPVAAVFDFAGNAAAAGASAAARRRKGRKSSKSQTAAARNAASAAAAEEDTQAEAEEEEAGLVPDMAIDPNEPKYCYCDQVSFGDMIACDNDDCPREWYHYNCVGLVSVPRGKWYCLFCAPPGWKGPGGDVPPNARYAPPGHKHGGSNKGRK